jgi:adenylate cyclase
MKRRLTAVLHADVKGYSRLMGEDEVATVRILTDYRNVLDGFVKRHEGRIVDTAGDGFLVEFLSVVSALDCAVEFQHDINTRNNDLPENQRMEFRIGIDVGEVIEQGDKIFGDGVNIAARLEGLAEGGGICISGNAYDQVKKRSRLRYQYIGEKALKNIGEPVRVYRVLMAPATLPPENGPARGLKLRRWAIRLAFAILIFLVVATGLRVWQSYVRPVSSPSESQPLQKPVSPAADIPSIAVLPFTNLSGDPEQEFFSDGITEEITTTLSKVPKLFVIASNSSFALKGKATNIQQVGRELRVRYVLEGSVRRSGDRVRVTAQLIDAETGHHLWAERYDQELKDVLKLQEEITAQIVSALQVKLTPGDRAWMKAEKSPSLNLRALEKFMQAMAYAGKEKEEKKETNLRARSLLEEAITLDPASSRAYAALARTYLLDIAKGWTEAPHESIAKVETYAQKAIALDDSSDFAHLIMSRAHLIKREHDAALREAQRAATLNPNGADAYASLAHILVFSGRPEEATALLEKAIQLNPISPSWYFTALGNAFMGIKRYDQAIEAYRKTLQDKADSASVQMFLAVTYSLAGRQAEAREAAEELLRLKPNFSVEKATERLPYKNPADLARIIDALRAAGLK